MSDSGVIVSPDDIPRIKVDEHSTGGVSDATFPVLLPQAALGGIAVEKMGRRGIANTGGKIDK